MSRNFITELKYQFTIIFMFGNIKELQKLR